jgi:histidinol-phosphate aminotransferase
MRARLIKTPLKNYGLDLDAMAAAVTPKTKLIFVCNPNNPTGTIVTGTEVNAFMKRVPDHVLLVFDEAYYELVDSKEYPDTLDIIRQGRENVITLRTFSKVYGLAGIRLGYGIAMPSVLAPMNQARESFAVNLLAQAAGIAALQDQDFLIKTVRANHASRSWLYEQFDRLGLFYVKSHTNFVLVRIGPHALDVQQELLKRGVIVRPCDGYDLGDFLRVTAGTLEQDARFIETLESVLAFGS